MKLRERMKNKKNNDGRIILYTMFFCIVAYIVIPVVLKRTVPDLSSKDWFSFIGSYAGGLVSILFGWIAYRQSEISEKQQEQINRFNSLIAQYQNSPIIQFENFLIEYQMNSEKILYMRDKVKDIIFSQSGMRWKGNAEKYIVISFDLIEKGILPVSNCELEALTWEIAGQKYNIKVHEYKRKFRMMKRISVIIDNNDIIHGENNLFFSSLEKHLTFSETFTVGHQYSELAMRFFFTNIEEQTSVYNVTCKINSDRMVDVEAGAMCGIITHVEMERKNEESR